jgi:hypothetical protein
MTLVLTGCGGFEGWGDAINDGSLTPQLIRRSALCSL